MGNPRYVYGVSYQVGTCRTQGFSARPSGYSCSVGAFSSSSVLSYTNIRNSPQARFKATATAQTPTAAPATTRTFTRATARFMVRPLSLSSRASSAAALAVDRLLPPGLPRLRRAPATRRLPLLRLVATARRSGDSAVVKGESFSNLYGHLLLLTISSSWTGPTCCQSGSTCKASNQYYSQCQ